MQIRLNQLQRSRSEVIMVFFEVFSCRLNCIMSATNLIYNDLSLLQFLQHLMTQLWLRAHTLRNTTKLLLLLLLLFIVALIAIQVSSIIKQKHATRLCCKQCDILYEIGLGIYCCIWYLSLSCCCACCQFPVLVVEVAINLRLE